MQLSKDFIMESATMTQGNSLIWVHIVCNKGYLRTFTDENVDDKSPDWREKVLKHLPFNQSKWYLKL